MRTVTFIRQAGYLIGSLIVMSSLKAAPTWTLTPSTATQLSIAPTETATIQYIVKNQSSRPHTLILGDNILGIRQITTPGNCANPFFLGPHDSCFLTLAIDGSALREDVISGPNICQQGSTLQCYQPSQENVLAIHLLQEAPLLLSVNCPSFNASCAVDDPHLSGHLRQVVVRNSSTTTATNVSVHVSGLPSGTSISDTTCSGTLHSDQTCTITFTPGRITSSDTNGTPCSSGVRPQAAIVEVTSNQGILSQFSVYVLSYSCIYQGGFIFAVDDTSGCTSSPCRGSITGKVAATTDIAPPLTFSLNTSGSLPWDLGCPSACTQTGAWEINFGQDSPVVATSTNPESIGTNGPGNTWLVSSILNGVNANTNEPPATYAVGSCVSYLGENYADWYLPAICELGPNSNSSGCSVGTQNMQENLAFLIGDPNAVTPSTSCSPPSGTDCLAGFYWSSTEDSSTFAKAWFQSYDSSNVNESLTNDKNGLFGTRCTRIF